MMGLFEVTVFWFSPVLHWYEAFDIPSWSYYVSFEMREEKGPLWSWHSGAKSV